MVTKSGNFSGIPFLTYIGLTQGYPVSLVIFNIVVDEVVRDVLLEVFETQLENHELV